MFQFNILEFYLNRLQFSLSNLKHQIIMFGVGKN